MSFGLQNAPDTCQRTMDAILSLVKWQFALDCLEHIVIFSKSLVQHIGDVRKVFLILKSAKMDLKLVKFQIFSETIGYLGHVILPRRLK